MNKNFFKSFILVLSFVFMAAFPAYADASFDVQPSFKDAGKVTSDAMIDINYNDGTIASLSEKADVTLEYLDGDAWSDTGVSLTVNADGSVVAPDVAATGNAINHSLRIVTEDDVCSDTFYVSANITSVATPSQVKKNGKNVAQKIYTAGEHFSIVPNVTSEKNITEIRWQVSHDGGDTYETAYSLQNRSEYILELVADCTMTGDFYRYAINPVDSSAVYSDPFELIVYEDYTVDGTSLTINNAGGSGTMNNYKEGRLQNLAPWSYLKDSITDVSFNNSIVSIGKGSFSGFTALKHIDFANAETIGESAFENCTALKTVKIPYGMTSIGQYAFSGCDNVMEFLIYSYDVAIADRNAFPDTRVTPGTLLPSVNNEELCANEHSYPVIYGFKGKALDTANSISAEDSGSTAYDLCIGSDLPFMQIGFIDEEGYERPVTWEYTLTGSSISCLRISSASIPATEHGSFSVHIPKSVDGYVVTKLSAYEPNVEEGQVLTCTKEEHTHTDECYETTRTLICEEEHDHSDDCYEESQTLTCTKEEHTHSAECYSGDYTDIFHQALGVAPELTLSELIIPDSVTEISKDTFYSVESCDDYYSFFRGKMSVAEYMDINNYCYTYSSNYEIRTHAPGVTKIILDVDDMTGITGSLVWELDIEEGTFSLFDAGASGDFISEISRPYNWAKHEVQEIFIESDVTYIGDYMFAGFDKVYSITNESKELESCSATAFDGVGSSSSVAGKTVRTPLDNALYDAITALNTDNAASSTINASITAAETSRTAIETQMETLVATMDAETDPATLEILSTQYESLLEQKNAYDVLIEGYQTSLGNVKFNIIFSDTTDSCGGSVEYTYNTASMTLDIHGSGAMNTFTSANDAPWRCVNSYIRKIVIGDGITSISQYAFNGIPNLKSVYNYGKNQTLLGDGSTVFDIIERHYDSTDGDYIEIMVPTLADSTEEAKANQREVILNQFGKSEIGLTDADLRGWTLDCILEHEHTDSCYIKGTEPVLVPGTYLLSATASRTEVVQVFTGAKADYSTEPFVVPVYTFGDDNPAFNAIVPSEANGYRLMNIFTSKGICGDTLTYYVALDGTLYIEGSGDMFNFAEGSSPWFDVRKTIKTVSLPTGLSMIGDYAFEGLELLTQIDPPLGVERIGEGAFKDCINLYSFIIKANVSSVGDGAFAGCSTLRILSSESANYRVVYGVLYDKDNRLIQYLRESLYLDPNTKTAFATAEQFPIPTDVVTIGKYAVYNSTWIKDLVITENITEISTKAFVKIKDLETIDATAQILQTVQLDSFVEVGTNIASGTAKYAIMYKVNENLANVLSAAGYNVVYHDNRAVDDIAASYLGQEIPTGTTFDPADVQIIVFFKNGEKESFRGNEDSRISFPTCYVGSTGENYFQAKYDDGYGEVHMSQVFVVNGVNRIINVTFSYNGSYVWVGDTIDLSYVHATLEYADGTLSTIDGKKTYVSGANNKNCITLSKTTIDSDGTNSINVSYQDAANTTPFTGVLEIKGKKYLTKIETRYEGEPVEYSAGLSGLNFDDVKITLTWCDGSASTNITGSNSLIDFNSKSTVSGSHLVFEFNVKDYNRYGYTGAFQVAYVSNLNAVDFAYVGGKVTKGTAINYADILLTLHYSNGTTKKLTGDLVNPLDLTCDNKIIETSDSTQIVNLTYLVEGSEFTGAIEVPGQIRKPLRLTVTKRPNTVVYKAGDSFNKTGMRVECEYDDGQSEDVSDKLSILNGDCLLENTKMITLSYTDILSGQTVMTNLSINVNQYIQSVSKTATFKEEYEISKVLFRSKMTEDVANAKNNSLGNDDDDSDDDSSGDDYGQWIDITPLENESTYDAEKLREEGHSEADIPVVKQGYGFELKVYVTYKTNRGGTEFENFLKKDLWDEAFSDSTAGTSIADEINTKYKYLNDVYPQMTPTTSPDVLYLRIINPNVTTDEGAYTTVKLNASDEERADLSFVVMERTNVIEDGGTDPAGEWYESTKVFELPLRTIEDSDGNDVQKRRVFVSSSAKDDSYYVLQLATPPWMGYEPEPTYSEGAFHYAMDEKALYGKTWSGSTPFLGAVYSFRIRVENNNDIVTSIMD